MVWPIIPIFLEHKLIGIRPCIPKSTNFTKKYSVQIRQLDTIIAGPTACEVIEDIRSFKYGDRKVAPGLYSLIGRLANRFDVWETFDLKNSDTIYVGNVDLHSKHCHHDLGRIKIGGTTLYPIQILNLPIDNR